MSTVARPSRAAHRPGAPCGHLSVRWSISRAAARRARPDLVRPDAGPELLLRWDVNLDNAGLLSGGAALIDGDRSTPLLSLIRAPGCWRREGGMDHLDIADLLTVSRETEGHVRFARTSLLRAWGISGGTYELAAPSSVSLRRKMS